MRGAVPASAPMAGLNNMGGMGGMGNLSGVPQLPGSGLQLPSQWGDSQSSGGRQEDSQAARVFADWQNLLDDDGDEVGGMPERLSAMNLHEGSGASAPAPSDDYSDSRYDSYPEW